MIRIFLAYGTNYVEKFLIYCKGVFFDVKNFNEFLCMNNLIKNELIMNMNDILHYNVENCIDNL